MRTLSTGCTRNRAEEPWSERSSSDSIRPPITKGADADGPTNPERITALWSHRVRRLGSRRSDADDDHYQHRDDQRSLLDNNDRAWALDYYDHHCRAHYYNDQRADDDHDVCSGSRHDDVDDYVNNDVYIYDLDVDDFDDDDGCRELRDDNLERGAHDELRRVPRSGADAG
jgi:hypothetical protein